MKTRYSIILKLKRQIVGEIENKLSRLEGSINSTRLSIEKLKINLCALSVPQSGEFTQALISHELANAYRCDITQNELALQRLFVAKHSAQMELSEAKKEEEKILYLENEEIRQAKMKKKTAEAKELDEIGMMLYNNKVIS